MVIYELGCDQGHRFEAVLRSMTAENPPCPSCGGATRRVPAFGRMSGTASAGPSREDMPNTWRGIGRGDAETVRHWHQQMSRRERLEEKYPELAGDRRPVLAHEGQFADQPLRAGDALVPQVAAATFGPRTTPATASTTTTATSTATTSTTTTSRKEG